MPSFLSNIRGLMGSSSSNNGGGSSNHDGMDHDHGHHGGGQTGGNSRARATSSLRHDSSGMTDSGHRVGGGGGGGGGVSTTSGRRLGGASGGRSAGGAGQPMAAAGQYGPPGPGAPPHLSGQAPAAAQRSVSASRRAPGADPAAYDEAGYQQQQTHQYGGAYSGGQSLQQQQSPGGRRGSGSNNQAPVPAQRSVSAGRAQGGRPRTHSQGTGAPGGPAGGLGPAGGAGGAPHMHQSYRSMADPPLGAPGGVPSPANPGVAASAPVHCLNPASDINARLDTQVEVRVYPCNNNASAAGQNPKKKFTQFTVKPEGVIIQGTNRHRSAANDLGSEYALHVGRKLQRYELSDTRACQLLVTTHNKSFWVVPAPEAFSRHSGTCRLLGDRKHPLAPHTLQVGDFLRVGSVGVVVIETHNGVENRVLSEEKIQKIMKDTTSSSGGFLDIGETDGENSDDSSREGRLMEERDHGDAPVCYMCFDEEDTEENPLITPCKCLGDTRYVHVNCLRKWHTAEADNQICFLSSVDATCSVCKSTFKSDFKLKDGRTMKLFKSSLEPPYVSLLVATKHEMAQRLFNTRFQLSFSTLLKPDGRNATRPLLLGRSSGSDMVLDYRTVSARHASIRFKNGEFIFTDAGSSNGSYLYLRRPVELTASQPVQFRLGRSMISMKVVNKWNRRLLRAVRRTGGSSGGSSIAGGGDGGGDDHSVGSNEDDVRVSDGQGGASRAVPRRTRESIMRSLPAAGTLSQGSSQHLDLLYALAYPKREKDQPAALGAGGRKKTGGSCASSSTSGLGASMPSSRRPLPPADIPGAGAPPSSMRGGPIPTPLVAPSPGAAGPPPGAAAPRGGSAVSAGGLMQQAISPEDPEESKVEVEEIEEPVAGPPHDDTLAPIVGSDDEEGDADDEADDEDEDDDIGGLIPAASSGDEETAILMMNPTGMTELSN